MANKHMRRYSILLSIKEMQIRNTSYYYTPIRKANYKIVTIPNADKLDHSFIAGGNVKS